MKKLLLAATALMLLFTSADAKGTKKSAKKPTRKAKPTYYVNGDGTYSTSPNNTDATRPSPYKGDKVPENDGVKKNKERNLNYTSQPVPTTR